MTMELSNIKSRRVAQAAGPAALRCLDSAKRRASLCASQRMCLLGFSRYGNEAVPASFRASRLCISPNAEKRRG